MKNLLFILIVLFISSIAKAQCPTISCPTAMTLTTCQGGQTIAATSNYSSNITSRWIGPGNIPIASVGTSTSVAKLNHIGTYTVEFKDNVSNCVVMDSVYVSDIMNKPAFNPAVSSYAMLCTSSQISISIQNANTVPPGGAITYTLIGPPTSSTILNGILSSVSIYTIGVCGNWEPLVRNPLNNCYSSFIIPIACSTLAPTPLSITGTNTVCLGSSVSYTSSGTNNYWSTGANGATMNITPSASTSYTAFGNDFNNCPSSGTTAVTVNNTCSQVWPGDANSDGIVDNTDVFEIGLALNATGPSRSPGGNTYTSQYASNWTGAVSTGKNLCHADCDGNGTINNSDTLAIYSNFLLTHAFKTSASPATNPEVSIVSQPIANAGLWNKAEIFLGDSVTNISNLYGIAFDLNYDQAVLETDSVYLVYTPSFLNSNGQNIQFKKTIFNSGKLFGTSVRTNANNVTGSGKIAELYFKVKFGLPENTVLNLSVSNVKKINQAGTSSTLSAGSAIMLTDGNTVGVKEKTSFQKMIAFYPNPTSSTIHLLSTSTESIAYSILDLNGKEIIQGEFTRSSTLDLSELTSGTYFIRFEIIQDRFIKNLL